MKLSTLLLFELATVNTLGKCWRCCALDRDCKEEDGFMEGDLGEKDIMEPIAGKL